MLTSCVPAGKHGFLVSGHGTVSSKIVCLLFHLLLPSLATTLCKVNLPATLVKVVNFFAGCVRLRALMLHQVSVPVRLRQDIEYVLDLPRSLESEQGSQVEQGTGSSGESSNEDAQSATHGRRKRQETMQEMVDRVSRFIKVRSFQLYD